VWGAVGWRSQQSSVRGGNSLRKPSAVVAEPVAEKLRKINTRLLLQGAKLLLPSEN
jgi:hypothetical protein